MDKGIKTAGEYGLWYPKSKAESDFMVKCKKENTIKCKSSKTENWFMDEYLKPLKESNGVKFSRQARRLGRIFDFWSSVLGVAVEIDGGYHQETSKKKKDSSWDTYMYERSRVVVIRVQNYDKKGAEEAIKKIINMEPWMVRRYKAGLLKKSQEDSYKESLEKYFETGERENRKSKRVVQ